MIYDVMDDIYIYIQYDLFTFVPMLIIGFYIHRKKKT